MNNFFTVTEDSKIRPLGNGYTAEFDTVDKDGWYKIIDQFSDANLFQTWDYDAIRCGKENISHLVLHVAEKVVAAAQARIASIPLLGWGAAYIRWGPLWQPVNQAPDPIIFQQALRALRNEYVHRRGLILRIFPILFDDNSNTYTDILSEEGYTPVPEEKRGRTLIIDVSTPIDDLRKKLDPKWRGHLNRAERNQLEVIEGTDDALFADFIGLYRALLDRKKFEEPNDINEFRMIQQNLPLEYKMRIFLCKSEGVISAGAICATIGETGVYLFGATNEQGMANKGSYMLQWKAIQWMKNNGCRSYNLYGINPQTNPGTYSFKAGLAGKSGKDIYDLGRFNCYPGAITTWLARATDSLLPWLKNRLGKQHS